jgi:integrase/recombinase XerC
MLDAGLRVGEVSRLTVDQLYYVGAPVGCIHLDAPGTKTKSSRDIPVTIRLHEALTKMNDYYWAKLPPNPHSYAFYTELPCEHVSIRQIQRIINQAARFSIGRKLHPHTLRHTFATKLMRKCPMRVVQQLLGHKSISSTEVYTHPNHQDLQIAIDSLNKRSSP